MKNKLKYAVLGLVLVMFGATVKADERAAFTITKTDTPALCQTNLASAPMPCAFAIAMLNRLKGRCTELSCSNLKTCSVKLK